MNEKGFDPDKSIIAELGEVNKRSHIYLAEYWQIPMAYLAATLISVSSLKTDNKQVIIVVIFLSLLLGIPVIFHMYNVKKRNQVATDNIIAIERHFKFVDKIGNGFTLATRAKCGYWVPLLSVVIISMIGYLILLIIYVEKMLNNHW